ncbi:MAG: IS66 family transposase, partial [Acidobacteria bacterium]|nr:IS66 family transposase [Acidobacteriota bacterium]
MTSVRVLQGREVSDTDIELIRALFAEHQADVKTCACGCVTRAAFPPEVTAPVQYGLRIKSVA